MDNVKGTSQETSQEDKIPLSTLMTKSKLKKKEERGKKLKVEIERLEIMDSYIKNENEILKKNNALIAQENDQLKE
jgi:hypothetical protein